MKILIDSGASVNLLDMEAYNTLKLPRKLKQTQMQKYPYGSNAPINLVGSFTASLKYEGDTVAAEFYATASTGGCLLSYNTVTNLGIIEVHVKYFNERVNTKIVS